MFGLASSVLGCGNTASRPKMEGGGVQMMEVSNRSELSLAILHFRLWNLHVLKISVSVHTMLAECRTRAAGEEYRTAPASKVSLVLLKNDETVLRKNYKGLMVNTIKYH